MDQQAATSDAPFAHVALVEQSAPSALTALAKAAFDRAWRGEGSLDAAARAIEGMSGQKYRLFINNLISTLPDARYLEVGCWAGSTLCAALSGNAVSALAIDNWSQFGGPAAAFFTNIARFKAKSRLSFLERDFRDVRYAEIGKFNVYLYDGPHSAQDQRDGVVIAQPALDDEFVLIVDDWNWADVRNGTLSALRELRLGREWAVEVRTSLDNSHPDYKGKSSDWHNGYMIGVFSKPAH
ncbi:MAG TPA: class I SAM-dependent methyltransferase [Acetobacteraceae bacterium]|jgi:hypothetical protein|nr:class I SAM-dependent methyltransferase [Acetobacteraceae bacterium]